MNFPILSQLSQFGPKKDRDPGFQDPTFFRLWIRALPERTGDVLLSLLGDLAFEHLLEGVACMKARWGEEEYCKIP